MSEIQEGEVRDWFKSPTKSELAVLNCKTCEYLDSLCYNCYYGGDPLDYVECVHTLHPDECVSCNPEYKDAALRPCEDCRATTWHLHEACLRCKEEADV